MAFVQPTFIEHTTTGRIIIHLSWAMRSRGIIEDLGQDCNDFNIGDKVSVFPLLPCFRCDQCQQNNYALCIDYSYYGSRCDGGYAEYLLVDLWNLMKISKNIELKDAVLWNQLQ